MPPAVVDYTDKDFAALRDAMLRLAELRLPEWTDRSPSDLGMLLVDLFAYMGDVALYYQDRIANELFPATASEARSIADLLRLIGYELRPVTPALADVTLTFGPPLAGTVTVPTGAVFTAADADGPLEFAYLGPDLAIDLGSDLVRAGLDADGNPVATYDLLPLEQSRGVGPTIIGSGSGEPNQMLQLADGGVVLESVIIEVDEGSGFVAWDRRDSLLFDIAPDGRATLSHPDARHYQVLVDGSGGAHVVFGAGRVPPPGGNNVRATFRTSAGTGGNVAAGQIREAVTAIPQLVAVTNPQAAAGGTDRESAAHAIRYAPLAYRSGNRAVTASDYVALVESTGAVARARAVSRAWNHIDVYVAPSGPTCHPVPEALRKRLLGFLEDKRMAGTLVRIRDARCVPIDIGMLVTLDGRFAADAVTSNVESAVRSLLDYRTVDFGTTVFLSDRYAAVEAVPGVLAVTIHRFRRRDAASFDVAAALAAHNVALSDLPDFVRSSLIADVAPEGRIEIGDFEIPVAGTLDVRTRTGTP